MVAIHALAGSLGEPVRASEPALPGDDGTVPGERAAALSSAESARIASLLGRSWMHLGLFAEAIPFHSEAIEGFRAAGRGEEASPAVGERIYAGLMVEVQAGRIAKSLPRRESGYPEIADAADARTAEEEALLRFLARDFEAAASICDRVAAAAAGSPEARKLTRARCALLRGLCLLGRGAPHGSVAEALGRAGIEPAADDPVSLLGALIAAVSLSRDGPAGASRDALRALADRTERVLPVGHPILAHARVHLAAALSAVGDPTGAREELARAIAESSGFPRRDWIGGEVPPRRTESSPVILAALPSVAIRVRPALARWLPSGDAILRELEPEGELLPGSRGSVEAARRLFESNLALLEACGGGRSALGGVLQHHLGHLCRELGDTAGRVVALEAAHAAMEPLEPEWEAELYAVKLCLAQALETAGREAEAVPHRRALLDRLDARGSPPLEAASAACFLARDLEDGPEPEEAVRLYRRALRTRVRALGESHRDVVSARRRLATVLGRLRRFAEAIEVREQIVRTLARRTSPDYLEVQSQRSWLARDLAGAGRFREASIQYAEALEVRLHLLPPDDPAVLSSRRGLAHALGSLGDLEGAARQYEAILAARADANPPDDPVVVSARQGLAWACHGLRRYEEAASQYRHLMAVHAGGSDQTASTEYQCYVGACLLELGRRNEARPHLESALRRFEDVEVASPDQLLTARMNLAALLAREDKMVEAGALERRAIDEAVGAGIGESLQAIVLRVNHAETLIALERRAEAISLLEEALEMGERSAPPGHECLGRARKCLRSVLEDEY